MHDTVMASSRCEVMCGATPWMMSEARVAFLLERQGPALIIGTHIAR